MNSLDIIFINNTTCDGCSIKNISLFNIHIWLGNEKMCKEANTRSYCLL